MALLPIVPTGDNPFTGFLTTLKNTIAGGNEPTGGNADTAGPKGEIMRWIANPPPGVTLDANQKAALFAWLNGAPLGDPALVQVLASALPNFQQLAVQAGAGPLPGAAPSPGPAPIANQTAATPVAAPGAAPVPSTPPAPQPSLGNTPAANGAPLLSPQAGLSLNEYGPAAQQQAARGAGLDPYGGGIASNYFANLTAPILQAMAPVFAFGQGGGSGGNLDPQAYTNQVTKFGQQMTAPGGGGLQMSRDLAQQVLSNPEFMTQLLGVYDTKQQGFLDNLQTLRNPSMSPLTEAYMKTQSDRLVSRYNDQNMGITPGSAVGQWGGRYTNYLDQDPEARALAERLYGYVPR